MKKQLHLWLAISSLAFAGVASAQVYLIGGNSYTATNPAETVNVGSSGLQTAESVNQYSGYVLVTVSGFWNPFGREINPELGCFDGFYFFGNASGSTNYNLAPDLYFGTSPITPASPAAIVPYDGNYPGYNTSHIYTFIADTKAGNPSPLYFGVGDSDYVDNTGSLSVQIMQLQPMLSGPTFTVEPGSQVVSCGDSVTFIASATGYPSPTYQWQFNGTNIGGATSASYMIPSTKITNIGYYTLLASNSVNTNSSSAASLTFLSVKMYAGLVIDGPIGATYIIQSASTLETTNWITQTNISLPSRPYVYIDYNSPTNARQFYRAVPQS